MLAMEVYDHYTKIIDQLQIIDMWALDYFNTIENCGISESQINKLTKNVCQQIKIIENIREKYFLLAKNTRFELLKDFIEIDFFILLDFLDFMFCGKRFVNLECYLLKVPIGSTENYMFMDSYKLVESIKFSKPITQIVPIYKVDHDIHGERPYFYFADFNIILLQPVNLSIRIDINELLPKNLLKFETPEYYGSNNLAVTINTLLIYPADQTNKKKCLCPILLRKLINQKDGLVYKNMAINMNLFLALKSLKRLEIHEPLEKIEKGALAIPTLNHFYVEYLQKIGKDTFYGMTIKSLIINIVNGQTIMEEKDWLASLPNLVTFKIMYFDWLYLEDGYKKYNTNHFGEFDFLKYSKCKDMEINTLKTYETASQKDCNSFIPQFTRTFSPIGSPKIYHELTCLKISIETLCILSRITFYKLEKLHLTNLTAFNILNSDILPSFPNLRKLVFDYNVPTGFLENNPFLNILTLSSISFKNVSQIPSKLQAFSQPHLRVTELEFYHCQFSLLKCEYLKSFPNLSSIFIRDHQSKCDIQTDFFETFPNVIFLIGKNRYSQICYKDTNVESYFRDKSEKDSCHFYEA